MTWLRYRAFIMERDGHRCVWCGDVEGPFHIDHVWPWSRGGGNEPENLVTACQKCNLEKGSKQILREWWPKLRSGWAYDQMDESAADRLPGEMES